MTHGFVSRFKHGLFRSAIYLPLVVGLPSARAQAVSAPVLPCQGASATSWLSAGVPTRLVCKQSMMHVGASMNPDAMDPLGKQPRSDGLTAAWIGNDVRGIRDWHPYGPPPIASDGLIDFSAGTLVEQGSVGTPGELWWGRVSGGTYRCCTVGHLTVLPINASSLVAVNQSASVLLAVGQETTTRQSNVYSSAEQLRQIRTGQLGPWPAGSRILHFTQHAATGVLSSGSMPVLPGTMSDAVLDLSVADQLSGTLRFMLQSDGLSAPVSIPLKRDVEESTAKSSPFGLPGNPYRLRHGRLAEGGRIVDCTTTRSRCDLHQEGAKKDSYSLEPQYSAEGMFFGEDGEYLAIVFEAFIPRPDNSKRMWGNFRGLVVLKRTP